jgi:GNAT superfamily N-acetyltransferase
MNRPFAVTRRRTLVPFPKELGKKAWSDRLASFGIIVPRAALSRYKRSRSRSGTKRLSTLRWLQWVESAGEDESERIVAASVIRWIAFPHRISLDWIAVAPDERGQGIGAAFLNETERYARSVVEKIETFSDLPRIELTAVVPETNLAAQRLLRGGGLRCVRTETDPLAGIDYYVFEKTIERRRE